MQREFGHILAEVDFETGLATLRGKKSGWKGVYNIDQLVGWEAFYIDMIARVREQHRGSYQETLKAVKWAKAILQDE